MSFNMEKALEFVRTSYVDCYRMQQKSKELKEMSRYDEIAKSIKTFELGFSSIEVLFSGSRIMGIGTDESDLDVHIQIDDKTSTKDNDYDSKFNKLATQFQCKQSWSMKDCFQYPHRNAVPAIFTVYSPLKIDCNISILNGLSHGTSKLIGYLFEIQPEAVPFYHFIRTWLKVQGFDHFNEYTITLLVLFYLQNKGLMPSVQNVQLCLPKKLIDGCEVQYRLTTSPYGNRMKCFQNYIGEFFKFYKDFNYDQVMSTYTGKAEYRNRDLHFYRNFLFKGIHIAGPCDREKNCGIIDDYQDVKQLFISLCKASGEIYTVPYY